jgi:hypothetical protein
MPPTLATQTERFAIAVPEAALTPNELIARAVLCSIGIDWRG